MTPSRLWLPALLGVIAAAGNYVVLQEATATTHVTAIRADLKDDLKAGTKLTAEHLVAVPVRGAAQLVDGVVLWDNRSSVVGVPLRRTVKRGELVFRADLENEASQFDLPPNGWRSCTVPARRAAVVGAPPRGQFVQLSARSPNSPAGPTVRVAPAAVTHYGPYIFLGWVAAPPGRSAEPDVIYVSVAVPRDGGPKEAELDAIRESNNPDRVFQVEAVRGVPAEK